jgi:hypothetical protein
MGEKIDHWCRFTPAENLSAVHVDIGGKFVLASIDIRTQA